MRGKHSVKPNRNQMIASGNDPIKNIKLFEATTSDKIEVRDDNERPVFSPKTGIFDLKGLNSVFD